jgi:integrase
MPRIKLTTQSIKALRVPSTGRVDYEDEVVRGLFVRVSSTGTKSYSVSWWHDGQRPRVTLGVTEDSRKRGPAAHVERLTLADARDRAQKVLAGVQLGADPAAERRERKADATFEEVCKEYLQRHAKPKKSKRAAREDELRIERVLLPRWGSRKANAITKRDVIELLDEYRDAGKGVASNRLAALLSAIFNIGIERNLPGVVINPASGLVDRDFEQPRTRVLTDDELRVLLPLFRGEGLAGLGFRFLLLTGQRPSEVFGATWSEIDGEVWKLPKARSKNRRSKHAPDVHIVPLAPAAIAVLDDLREVSDRTAAGFIFPSRIEGKPFTGYQKAAERVMAAAKLKEDWQVYDLKSTALTGLAQLGTPPHVVSAIANHISATVTSRHYAFPDLTAAKAEALAAWAEHVEALEGPVVAKKRRPARRKAVAAKPVGRGGLRLVRS